MEENTPRSPHLPRPSHKQSHKSNNPHVPPCETSRFRTPSQHHKKPQIPHPLLQAPFLFSLSQAPSPPSPKLRSQLLWKSSPPPSPSSPPPPSPSPSSTSPTSQTPQPSPTSPSKKTSKAIPPFTSSSSPRLSPLRIRLSNTSLLPHSVSMTPNLSSSNSLPLSHSTPHSVIQPKSQASSMHRPLTTDNLCPHSSSTRSGPFHFSARPTPALKHQSTMPSGAYDIAVEIALPALLRGLTTKDDIRNVQKLCQQLVGVEGQAWHVLFSTFFTTLVSTRDALPTNLVAREIDLSPDWFREPWYLMYPQWTGLEEKDLHTPSNFDTLRAMLPHIRHTLGFKNICLLPHYESPMADAGRDLSSYSVRESLGGREAFLRFMQDAHNLDMRVATDALFTHTSTEHPWFQSALSGDHKYLAYYLQRNGREKIAEWDDQGEIVCRYRDADGTITDRIVAYPHVDRTHGLWVEIHGKTYQFYRSGFPFQVDLNLRNVELVEELFGVLADEVLCGVLGKRLDSVAEWVKKGGVKDVGLSECHVLQAIFKSFLKHLHCRAVIISDVVGDVKRSASYSGMNTHINGEACSSEGDAILGIGMKAALQESMFFQSVVPFWRCVFRGDDLSGHSTWLNMLEDHNEMHMNLFPGEVRRCMVEYIKAHGGMVYNNETRGCIRHADSLGNKGERLATAIFMLYMAPGTPLIYAGTEIEACNNWEHAKREAVSSKQIFEKVGVYATPEARFDARNLQRGGLLRSDLRKAEEHEAGRLVKRMNELRSERECLRVANIRAVDCGDVGVLCMGRGTEGDSVLCIANLTSLEKLVSIPLRSAAEFVGRGVMRREKKRVFVDLISGKKVELLREGLYVKMSLHGFSYAVIQQSTDEGEVY